MSARRPGSHATRASTRRASSCLPATALRSAPPEIRRRAVQQVVMTVGGHPYPPRRARLERLLEQLRDGLVSGRTLAGCRILPWRGALLICREAQAIEEEALLAPGVPLRWDGRFRTPAERQGSADGAGAGPHWHARARRRLEPGAAGAGASEPALALAPGSNLLRFLIWVWFYPRSRGAPRSRCASTRHRHWPERRSTQTVREHRDRCFDPPRSYVRVCCGSLAGHLRAGRRGP